MEEAINIAIAHEISAYDAAYVALSRRVNAPLLTLDRKLFKRMKSKPLDVQLFNDFIIPIV